MLPVSSVSSMSCWDSTSLSPLTGATVTTPSRPPLLLRTVPVTAGTLATHQPLFVGLLVGVILIMTGLTYFPALSLGPIAEALA